MYYYYLPMERNRPVNHIEILAQSIDPFALAEAASALTETPEEATALIAVHLSNVRQTNLFLESVTANQEETIEQKTHQITKDELGLNRREAFSEDIETAFGRFNRDPEHTFAVGLFDLDNLKTINDNIGHFTGGDRYLIKTVDAIQSVLRAGDKIYRLGGDEIVGLFYKMDEPAAEVFVQRLRHALVQQYALLSQELHSDSATSSDFQLLQERMETPFSVSLGMSYLQDGDTPEALLDRADKAMYEQKKTVKRKSEKFYPVQ